MIEKVSVSTRESSDEIWKTNEMFKKVDVKVDDSVFARTHLFNSDGIISSEFREYLYNILDVSKVDDLIAKLPGEWSLIIENGINDPLVSIKEKKIFIYYEDYELFYEYKKSMKNSSKTVKDLFNSNKRPSTANITKIVEKIADRSTELEFTEREKFSLSKSIPTILKENNIKLQKDDVFDINKVAIKEVINIGRLILSGNRTVVNKLNVKDVNRESTWQKYFERFGTYLLFGSIKLDPQVCLDKEKTKEFNNKYPDILTVNRYGFLDIIELKRSDVELFKFDSSHNKLVPTPYLSGALSQLNGYLQTIPYAFNVETAKKQSLECASGMIIIGSSKKLIKETADLKKWCEKNNIKEEDLKFEVRKELRKLNYSYSHMQVVLYDELIDTLEQFINNMY